MAGYCAIFAGLGSAFNPRYKKGTKAIAARIIDAQHYASPSGYSHWQSVAQDIVKLHKAGKLPRPLSLIGHSNGVFAILKIAEYLAAFQIEIDYLASIDKTLKICPKAQGNIHLIHDFWAGLKKVELGDKFKGEHVLLNLDRIANGVGHVEAAALPFTQNKIVETVLSFEENNMPQLPPELLEMESIAKRFLDPDTETTTQTMFNKEFFKTIRPLFKAISPSRIDGMKTIIHAFDEHIKPKGYGDELLAFGLGNIFGETGGSMWPLRETNAKSHNEAIARLDAWWASGKARRAGVKQPYWTKGYYGRGLLQETHFDNYSKAGILWEKWFSFPLDFIENPDLFLIPIVSSLSAFIGCIEGKYTGRKFAEFSADGKCNFAEARSIINGDSNLHFRDVDGDGITKTMGEETGRICDAFLQAIINGRKAVNGENEKIKALAPSLKNGEIVGHTVALEMGNIDIARQFLKEKFPALDSQHQDLVLVFAMLMKGAPPGFQPLQSSTSPASERGFSLPLSKKGSHMFSKTFNFKSKTVLTGMFSILAGLAMFILPDGHMFLEMARSFFPNSDPGTLVTAGLAIIFAREAIAKNGNGS